MKELVHSILLDCVIQPVTSRNKTLPHVSALRLLGVNGKTTWGRECVRMVKYFMQRREEDGSYYFAIDLGDDGTIR